MTNQRQRLSNDELNFYEDAIAHLIATMYDAHAIVQLSDDPDVLDLGLRILNESDTLRQRIIRRMRQRKAAIKTPPAATGGDEQNPDE